VPRNSSPPCGTDTHCSTSFWSIEEENKRISNNDLNENLTFMDLALKILWKERCQTGTTVYAQFRPQNVIEIDDRDTKQIIVVVYQLHKGSCSN
jgi:hypothetical protein